MTVALITISVVCGVWLRQKDLIHLHQLAVSHQKHHQ